MGETMRALSVFVAMGCLAGSLVCSGCGGPDLGAAFTPIQQVSSDKAMVYIYRPVAQVERWVVFQVYLNGQEIRGIAEGAYYPYSCSPGAVKFGASRSLAPISETTMVLEAGKTYYMKVYPATGVAVFHPKIINVNEQIAQPEIVTCNLMPDE
jgi:Protein of unknown function (DUF2846)